MMKRAIPGVLILMILAVLLGCGSGKSPAVVQKQVEAPALINSDLSSEKVDHVISVARDHYFLGERELHLGHLEKARKEFDAALDLLMKYQASVEPDPRIESTLEELEAKIYNHEMAALKAGDGFTENPLEPAMIDDLKQIETFPPADQKTRDDVEEELKTITYDIPVTVNEQVLSFVSVFQKSRRKEFVGGLIRSGRYIDFMKEIFRQEGLPEDLVYTALIESSFKSNAYSRARAKGFWQFISGTARRYDLRMDWWMDERSDFEKSTRAAARYLRDLHGMFGDWYLALAAYNAGENKIAYGLKKTGARDFWQLARTRYIRQETKNYVPAILAGMIISKDPKKYGFDEEVEQPLEWDTVVADYTVDLRLVAECTGATLEEIRLLNPELSKLTTPSRDRSYTLRVPKGSRETFLAEIAGVPKEKRVTWRKHEIQPGETLTSIAAVYRTSVGAIASANSFTTQTELTPGQKLVIPIGRSGSSSYKGSTSSSSRYSSKQYYYVKSGDTLSRIAQKFRCTVQQLCAWNGISSYKILRPGEPLIVRTSSPGVASVPSGSKKIVYEVKRGDTLYQIANSFNTDVESLKRWNKRTHEGLQPGERLTIYTK